MFGKQKVSRASALGSCTHRVKKGKRTLSRRGQRIGGMQQVCFNAVHHTQQVVLKISAVTWRGFKPEENKSLPVGKETKPQCEVKVGDFSNLRVNTAKLVARSLVVDETPKHSMLNDKLLLVVFPSELSARYLNLFNSSQGTRAYDEIFVERRDVLVKCEIS